MHDSDHPRMVIGEGLERIVEVARTLLREQGLSDEAIEAELNKQPQTEHLGLWKPN